mgnify:CR=1 FL=1
MRARVDLGGGAAVGSSRRGVRGKLHWTTATIGQNRALLRNDRATGGGYTLHSGGRVRGVKEAVVHPMGGGVFGALRLLALVGLGVGPAVGSRGTAVMDQLRPTNAPLAQNLAPRRKFRATGPGRRGERGGRLPDRKQDGVPSMGGGVFGAF